MSSRFVWFSLAALAACGGTAIVDPVDTTSSRGGGGAGGTITTSSSSSSGGGPVDCAELEIAYQQALAAAKSCATDIAFPQCSELVDDQLGCPCPTSINPENIEAIDDMGVVREQWLEGGCAVPCDDVLCPEIQGTTCQNDTCVEFGND